MSLEQDQERARLERSARLRARLGVATLLGVLAIAGFALARKSPQVLEEERMRIRDSAFAGMGSVPIGSALIAVAGRPGLGTVAPTHTASVPASVLTWRIVDNGEFAWFELGDARILVKSGRSHSSAQGTFEQAHDPASTKSAKFVERSPLGDLSIDLHSSGTILRFQDLRIELVGLELTLDGYTVTLDKGPYFFYPDTRASASPALLRAERRDTSGTWRSLVRNSTP